MTPSCPVIPPNKLRPADDCRFGAPRWRALALCRLHDAADSTERKYTMGYGIGGILVLILVILAIIFFAKRV